MPESNIRISTCKIETFSLQGQGFEFTYREGYDRVDIKTILESASLDALTLLDLAEYLQGLAERMKG